MDQRVTATAFTDEAVVAKYLEIRNAKAALVAKHEAQLKPFNEAMAKLADLMLARLNERGADNTKTPVGTAYKSRQVSCTMADRDAFLNYVQEHAAWSLVTNHVSKEAVSEIIDLTGSPPPGVSYEARVVVNFRKG